MATLYFNYNIDEIKTLNNKSVNGTLLVPKIILKKLDELRYIKSNSIEDLIKKFSTLIEKRVIHVSPNIEKHTTLYQSHDKEKINLIRCHFRSNPMVWHHWKRLANHFGVSMCYLFFICLNKVNPKHLDSVGTPTESLHLNNFLFFEITNFIKSYSHRWFYSRSYIKKLCKK